ncbi:MAG: aminomethyl-transferring glycine dehydrogenase subunit GcvPA [Anaerolineales bacterium]|nr:aminomethyl-transferring glycine dehydrogenase subunit GcvPA [Anaerolineales bacterium]
MTFLPHTDSERRQMLDSIGVSSVEELFSDVPEDVRFPDLDLPAAISEMEVLDELQALADRNVDAHEFTSFLGAGAYDHFVPSVVRELLRRGEFYTAYTPYQPEVSQGTLQAIFEFQSLITHLTGMEVANASVYDGATALAEAVNMALNHHRGSRHRIVLAPTIHPEYREVVETYMRGNDVEIVGGEVFKNGVDSLASLVDEDTSIVAVQYPDFLGHINDYQAVGERAHEVGALFCVVVNPIALGVLKPPSTFGADIVVGEGQPLGIPLSYGGPYLGLFATKEEYVRRMPGRLVGETTDVRGQRGYVLTLTPREQHIRRARATSNICTNQGLMALAATIYLSALGEHGLRRVAELCFHKAHYLADSIDQLDGFSLWNKRPFFNEFVVRSPLPVAALNDRLLEKGIIGGYDLGTWNEEFQDYMLLAVTERNSRDQLDGLVNALREVSHA